MLDQSTLDELKNLSPLNTALSDVDRDTLASKMREAYRKAGIKTKDFPLWIRKGASVDALVTEVRSLHAAGLTHTFADGGEAFTTGLVTLIESATETRPALKVAKTLTALLQKAEKSKDGFPSSCYGLVENKNDPDTWRFRIANVDGTPNLSGMREAMTFMSTATADVEMKEFPVIKEKLWNLEEREIAGQSEALLSDTLRLVETEHLGSKGTLEVVVIQPGFNATMERFYSREALAAGFPLYENVKMFLNHATEEEEFFRPERSLADWVAVLQNVRLGEAGEILGTAHIVDPEFKHKVEHIKEQDQLAHLGVSHNTRGVVERKEVDDIVTFFVSEIIEVRSVDFVTEPGAGGRALILESKRNKGEFEMDPTELKKLQESVATLQEDMTALKESNTFLEAENATLKETILELEEAAKKGGVQSEIDALLTESKLPEHCQKRLQTQFASTTTIDGVKEAIDTEATYVKDLIKNQRIVEGANEGDEDDDEDDAKGAERLVEELTYHYEGQGHSTKEALALAESAAK